MNAQNVGYSGTPLAKKLGIVDGCRVVAKHSPSNYHELLQLVPDHVVFGTKVTTSTDIVHIFVERRAALEAELVALRNSIRPNASIWVSWPKKASKMPTDITEDTIREAGLPLGFVDVKVCAVSDIWSGLKLVIRKELR
jgi:hypothetical protein